MTKVTQQQINLASQVRPEYFVDGVFQGDDNDMACLISNVADEMRRAGAPLYACYMVECLANDAGIKFFLATWEQYQAAHQ